MSKRRKFYEIGRGNLDEKSCVNESETGKETESDEEVSEDMEKGEQ